MAAGVVAELAARARETGRLGIDTEFMGEGRYRSLLCLVQVAVEEPDGSVRVEVLDPIAAPFDAGPLAAVLEDPAVEIILHAGRQDVALLRRVWRCEITSLFDTQIAAGFAGMRAQLGYEALLSATIGVKLRKSASFTKWDQRPLSEEQVSYAREDVLHLFDLADDLQTRLERRGRLDWAREECRLLQGASDAREPETVFNRLPRVNSMDPAQRAVAFELVLWRERTAESEDRTVPSTLADAQLVEIAKRRPQSVDRLSQIRGLHEGIVRRRGKALIDAVRRGRERDPIAVEGERPPSSDSADAPLVALGEALIRTRAAQSELAYELIAARADLQRVVTAVRTGADEPAVRTLQGWRREVVGAELLDLLAGRISLRVGEDRRIAVSD
jgi:ribonuclease D